MRDDMSKYLLVAILGGIVGGLLVVLGIQKAMSNMMPRLMAGMMRRMGGPEGANPPDLLQRMLAGLGEAQTGAV
jgi:hypothetical protein